MYSNGERVIDHQPRTTVNRDRKVARPSVVVTSYEQLAFIGNDLPETCTRRISESKPCAEQGRGKQIMSNFIVNTANLLYILKQIKIGEATSAAYTPDVAPVSILQAIMDAYGTSAATGWSP